MLGSKTPRQGRPTPASGGDCARVERDLLAFLHGDLAPDRHETLARHLAGCPFCRRSLESLEQIEAGLSAEASRQVWELPAGIRQRAHQRLPATLRKGVLMQRVRFLGCAAVGLARAAAVLAVLALVAILLTKVGATLNHIWPAGSPSAATRLVQFTGEEGNLQLSGEVITFAVYAFDQDRFEPLITAFQDQNPGIQVQLVALPDTAPVGAGEYYHSLASAADTALVLPFGPRPQPGTFRDLQPLIEADAAFDPNDFWPGMLAACPSAEGQTGGVPLYANLGGVFYDEAAFRAAGLDLPTSGWTWDDFRRAVSTLAARDASAAHPSFADQPTLARSILAPLVSTRLEASGGAIDPPALAGSLDWYLDLARAGSIYPFTTAQEDLDRWYALFAAAPPPALWPGFLSSFKPGGNLNSANPFDNLAIAHYGFAPYPVPAGGYEAATSPVSVACAAISAGSQHPRAAWAWISFLTRQSLAEGSLPAVEFGQVPARPSVAQGAGFWPGLPEATRPAAEYILAHAWYGPQHPQALAAVETAVSRALSGAGDLETALAQAAPVAGQPPTPPATAAPLVVPTPRPTPAAGTTTIRFYALAFDAAEEQSFQTAVQDFQLARPDVRVELGTFRFPFQDTLHLFRALSDQFDCFTWYDPLLDRDAGEAGELLSLSPFLDAEDPAFVQDYYPGLVAGYRLNGEVLGLPVVSQPLVMAYNADLLAARGLQPPTLDWTFADFLQLATAAAGGTGQAQTYGFLYSDADDFFLEGQGVHWVDLDLAGAGPLRAEFDQQGLAAALTWLSDLKQAGVLRVHNPSSAMGGGAVAQELKQGRIAFWMTYAGQPAPNGLLDSWDALPYQVGVVPLPYRADGTPGNYQQAWDRGFFISSQTENGRACWDWIRFLAGREGLLQGVPARRSLAQSPEWEGQVGHAAAQVYRLAIERIGRSTFQAVQGPVDSFRSEAIEAVLNGGDPLQAIAEAQRKTDAYLACMAPVDRSQLSSLELSAKVLSCFQDIH